MRFDLRSLVLGMALGLIIGIYISPSIDSPKIQPLSSEQAVTEPAQNPAPARPSNPDALKAIFKAQGWDYETQGAGAELEILRCAPSLARIVCDLKLMLPWVEQQKTARVEFGKDGVEWVAGKMKTINE